MVGTNVDGEKQEADISGGSDEPWLWKNVVLSESNRGTRSCWERTSEAVERLKWEDRLP